MATLTETIELEVEDCRVCGVPHAIPKAMRTEKYNNGGAWYCPNGHHIGWTAGNCKTGLQKLREENARLSSKVHYQSEQLGAERKRTAAAKAEAEKERKRIANGVCRCCNRSFQNLRRHIATKHPEIVPEKLALPAKPKRGRPRKVK